MAVHQDRYEQNKTSKYNLYFPHYQHDNMQMSVCVSVLLGGSTDTRGLQYGDWKPIIPSRRHFSNRAGQNLDYIDEVSLYICFHKF